MHILVKLAYKTFDSFKLERLSTTVTETEVQIFMTPPTMDRVMSSLRLDFH